MTLREITTHHTNDANKALKLTVLEDESGEPYHYLVQWKDGLNKTDMDVELAFQHRPIKEVGVNGLTNEVLLAIVRHRLEHFQTTEFACEENNAALAHVIAAANRLEDRTKRRTEQGVEGTHELDKPEREKVEVTSADVGSVEDVFGDPKP